MNEGRLVTIFLSLAPDEGIYRRKYRHNQKQAKPEEHHSITEVFLWSFKQLDKEVQMEEQVACQEEPIVDSEVEEHQQSSEHPDKYSVLRVLNPSFDRGIEQEVEKPYDNVTLDELPAVDGHWAKVVPVLSQDEFVLRDASLRDYAWFPNRKLQTSKSFEVEWQESDTFQYPQ